MFIPFFYDLRENGINVSPTAFLRLQKALGLGLVTSWDDFYSVARAILNKSERDFDAYDKVFVNFITGVERRRKMDSKRFMHLRELLGYNNERMSKMLNIDIEEVEAFFLGTKQIPEKLAKELEDFVNWSFELSHTET